MKRDLCVMWELDQVSRKRLSSLSCQASGSPFLCTSFHPHITLGCYEQVDDRRLLEYVRRFAEKAAPFRVYFEAIGLLNPCLPVCFPAFRGALRQHYFAFHRRFDNYADRWTALSGGLYTPHVSLDGGGQPLDAEAQRRLEAAFNPFPGRVEGLSLSWIRGEYDYQVIASFSLPEQPAIAE